MMKLFQHSSGAVIAFGFDMEERRPSKNRICWCDPISKEWMARADNLAGWSLQSFDIAPEFVFECDGRVIAYQPGLCIEMTYTGAPYVWSIRPMFANEQQLQAA